MTEFVLQNKELEEALITIFEEIEDGITIKVEYIIDDLQNVINELNEIDKQNTLQYINRQYIDQAFVTKLNTLYNFTDVQPQQNEKKNHVALYEELKQNHQYDLILKQMKDMEFCKQNQIPQLLFKNIVILKKIINRVRLILKLLDNKINNKLIPYFEILQILVQLVYNNQLNKEEQDKLEEIIGSLLTREIYQFQYYLDYIKQNKKEQYDQLIECTQQKQLKLIEDEQIKEKLENLPISILFLYRLFTSDLMKMREQLNEYFLKSFQLKKGQLNSQTILEQFKRKSLSTFNYQEAYFSILWYLWSQYCQCHKIIRINHILNIIQIKKYADVRKILYQRALNYLKQTDLIKTDQIIIYFTHRVIYFCQEDDCLLNKEEYQAFVKKHEEFGSFSTLILSNTGERQLEMSFNEILEEIRNKILIKDADIVQELDCLLEKANEQEKQKMLQLLNSEFKMYSFMKTGNYLCSNAETQQSIKDYKLMYNNAKSEQNYQQILDILQNYEKVEFLTQNNFPQILGQHRRILKNIGIKMFDLFDFLLELQSLNYSQFRLLRILLKYIYCSKLNKYDQIYLEQIIGSQMMNQIYQLQVYIDGVRNQNPQDFDQLILNIQKQQIQVNQDNIQIENQQISFFFCLFTQNINKELLRQNLDAFILRALNINDELINFNKINYALYQLIDQKIKFQECFISVTMYYCLQYLQHIGLNQKLNQLKEQNNQIEKVERKQKLYHRFLKDSWDQNDEIFVHIVNRCVYFNPKIEEFIDLENYKKYLNNKRNMQSKKILEYKSLKNLLKLSKEQFQEYWIQLKTLNYNDLQEFHKHDNLLNQKFTIFLWMTDQDQIYPALIKLFQDDSSSILQCISKNIKDCQMFQKFTLVNLFTIVSEYNNFQKKDLEILSKSLIIYDSLKIAMMLLRHYEIIIRTNLSKTYIQLLTEYKLIHWILIKQFFETNLHTQFIEIIINHYQSTKSAEHYFKLYQIQRILSPNKIELYLYRNLIQNIDSKLLFLIFKFNQSKKIPNFPQLKIILCTFYALHDKLKLEKQQFVFENLHILFDYSFINFKQLHISIVDGISLALIHKMICTFYFNSVKQIEKLKIICQEIYIQNKDNYEKWFAPFNYFDILSLNPLFLKRFQVHQRYLIDLEITLEEFNIYMAVQTEKQLLDLIKKWMQEKNNRSNFKDLFFFFFNLIKREENTGYFLSLFNTQNGQSEFYNIKALFQILFNNSNQELQFMLLKFRSKIHPVPFIYQNPHFSTIQKEEDLYQLNHQLFYIFLDSFTIINFSLSKNNSQYGKTQLINKIFFQMDKFETCDTCEINQNTIDIIFDYSFNNSRNFTIADIHGQIPFSIMQKILPLFKLWIIQINTEEELDENIRQVKRLAAILEFNFQPKICIIVRNVQIKQEQKNVELSFGKRKINIDIHFTSDLTKKGLDREEIDETSKFVFSQIAKAGFPTSQNQTSEDFLYIVETFNKECRLISNEIKEGNQIIQSILKNLENLIQKPEGFINQGLFPIRSINFQIKTLKEKLRNYLQEDKYQQEIVENLKEEIEKLQHSLTQQKSTEILMQFCCLFNHQNYYVLYLLLTDKIRKFNGENSHKLQNENDNLDQEKQNLRFQKNQTKNNSEALEATKQRISEIQILLKYNLTKIQYTNIGIEIFWREIIQQKQLCLMTDLKIDPVKTIFQMLQKGEPFEFLDGDLLQINKQFLKQIIGNFQNNGDERVLVLSVLGSQSSGKSTILNKIFGCHFWTSVGRCTKGIYFQILKIHNKQYYNNLFDYILILDTEGLQNFNQEDSEFDKKIALFVLAISDIILINVKGDISQSFKNFVEMCIYTLGQMQSNFSSIKQISWCFNQNLDVNNFQPFLEQIQGIANNLNAEFSCDSPDQKVDIAEILDIKRENIQILGFSSYEKSWKNNNSLPLFEKWRQLFANDTYSQEAYIYGIKIISNFVSKFKESSDSQQMTTLNQFIQNMDEIWGSIQQLPDLLEFSELIQLKQNQLMKDKFEEIYNQQNFIFTSEISKDISDKVQQCKRQSVDIFTVIQKKKEEEIITRLETIRESITQDLYLIKAQYNVSRKITQKYHCQLAHRINSQLSQCKIKIFEEIKRYERLYQEKQGLII